METTAQDLDEACSARDAAIREAEMLLKERDEARAAVVGCQHRAEEFGRDVERERTAIRHLLLSWPETDGLTLPAAVDVAIKDLLRLLNEERSESRKGLDEMRGVIRAVRKALQDATGEPVPVEMSLAEAVSGLVEDLEARAVQAEAALERLALKIPAGAGTTEPLPPATPREALLAYGMELLPVLDGDDRLRVWWECVELERRAA